MVRELPKKPSKRQREVLEFIRDFTMRNRVPPSIREIGAALGITSSTVFQHLRYLERKGYLRNADRSSRSFQLVEPVNTKCTHCVGVPLVGRIAAGQPILAVEDRTETIPVARELMRGKETFALKVEGESMVDAGIFDGDYVIVSKQDTAEEGDIVVALIEDEATLKIFHKEGKRIRLDAANKNMKPIYVKSGEFHIQGKVVGVQRRYDRFPMQAK
ncbi:MAG TPA: transcriptional repressor LexA [Planctomycetes bacterium]|nr:transcriptional repressor LexA [Planctomycetota bacterium]